MINSKLFHILKSFSRNELKEFEKFLVSPFFSKGRDLLPLFNSLKKFYPLFDDADLTYETIYTQVYGKKKYSYDLINKMFSEMLKAAEEYLIQSGLSNDFFERKKLLLNELVRRKLDSRYKLHMKETEEFLNSKGIYEKMYSDKSLLESLKYDFNFLKDKQEQVTENVVKRSEYNLMQFLITSSIDIHNLSVNNISFNSPYHSTSIFKFLSSIDWEIIYSQNDKHNPNDDQLKTFFINKTITTLKKDLKYFNQFKNFFYENIDKFEPELRKALAVTIDSAFIELSKYEDETLMMEQFEFIQMILKYKVYHYNDGKNFPVIPYQAFLNHALFLNEIDWAEQFIKDYCPLLEKYYVDNMFHFSYALLFNKKGEFEKSLEECSKVKFENNLLNQNTKLIILINYYELKEFDAAISFIDSFLHFVSDNKKMSDDYSEYLGNCAKYLKRLIQLNDNVYNSEKISSLKHDIENETKLFGKRWLLKKINELIN